MIEFLHIGKTGGSAVREALGPLIEAGEVKFHSHDKRLSDIRAGQQAAFFVRHPLSRFVSAFNSRMRRGQPRYDIPWKPLEEEAFTTFGSANALAEALESPDQARREQARRAMQAVKHLRQRLTDFLGSPADIQAREADIAFVGFQKQLDADFERMKRQLGFPMELSLPRDEVGAHRTPDGFDTRLSEAGAGAVARWYRDDLELYDALERRYGA